MSHVSQLQWFIATAGPALLTVSTLTLELPKERHGQYVGGEDDTAALLSPLASLCPALRTLGISGKVGVPLLAAFGVSCEQLTNLEVTDVPSHTLETMMHQNALPRITSTRLHLFGDEYEDEDSPEDFEGAIS